MKRMIRITCVSAAIVCAGARGIAGGETSNIRGMGMGRTFVASSRGLDAAGINPANLAFDDGNTFSISLMPAGTVVGSDFMTYGMYSKYFTGVETDSGRVGRYLLDADKQEILDSFTGGAGNIIALAEARPIGIRLRLESLGAFAFTITERVTGHLRVPQQYLQFLLYGNTPGSVYDFSATGGAAEWTREYAFNFARELPGFMLFDQCAVGAAVKVVHGYAHIDIRRFGTRLSTGMDGVLDGTIDALIRRSNVEALEGGAYNPFPAAAGSGMAYDFGFSGIVGGFVTAGISVTDIGSIRWSRNIEETYADGVIHLDNPLDEAQRDSVERALEGEGREGEPFTTSLPTMVRLGFSVELHKIPVLRRILLGELTVACDFNKCLEPAPGINTGARFSAGLEYRPIPQLPIRTGFSVGGLEESAFAVGIGFHLGFFELDLASSNLGWMFDPDSFSHGSVAVGMKLGF